MLCEFAMWKHHRDEKMAVYSVQRMKSVHDRDGETRHSGPSNSGRFSRERKKKKSVVGETEYVCVCVCV